MKQAIMIGAGNIGRAMLGFFLVKNNHQIKFNQKGVNQLMLAEQRASMVVPVSKKTTSSSPTRPAA